MARDAGLAKLRLLTDRIMLRRMKKDHTASMELPPKRYVALLLLLLLLLLFFFFFFFFLFVCLVRFELRTFTLMTLI